MNKKTETTKNSTRASSKDCSAKTKSNIKNDCSKKCAAKKTRNSR